MAVESIYEDLTLSVLAVNNHPLTKVFPLLEGLRTHGLLDFHSISSLSHDEVVSRLVAAGYDRGPGFNARLADRVLELARYVDANGLEEIQRGLAAGAEDTVNETLLKIYGIGPAVVRNFWSLQAK